MGSNDIPEGDQQTVVLNDVPDRTTITLELAVAHLRDHLLREFQTKDEAARALDPSGQGCLYFEDFQATIKKLSIPVGDLFGNLDVRSVFRELDIDGSGQLAVKEIFETNPWRAEEQAVLLLRDCLRSRFGSKFDIISSLDDDGSDSISCSKLELALVVSGIPLLSITGGVSLCRIYDFLDADYSSLISWTSLLESDVTKASQQCQDLIKQFQEKMLETIGSEDDIFSKLTTNESSSISYCDLKSSLERNNIPVDELVSSKDLRWYFRMLDVMGSGKICTRDLFEQDPLADAGRLAESRRKRYRQKNPTDGRQNKKRGMLPSRPSKPLGAGTGLGKALKKVQEWSQRKLEEENEELKNQLHAKVWTMSLARVADMERAKLGTASDEHFALPGRIAALEVAIFGSSASKEDLAKQAAALHELQILRADHAKLLDECQQRAQQTLSQWHDSGSEHVQGDFGKTEERCHEMQTRFTKLKVEHFQLEMKHKELNAAHKKVLQEMKHSKSHQTVQHRQLRNDHARNFEDLQRLKALKPKMEAQLSQLLEENLKLKGELTRIRQDPGEVQQLRSDHLQLQDELEQVKADYNKLCKKHELLRKQLTENWESKAKADQEQALPEAVSSTSSPGHELPVRRSISELPSMPQRPPGMERSESRGTVDMGRARSRSSVSALDRPNSASFVKHRMLEIQGKVRYCEDRWQEWHSGNISKT